MALKLAVINKEELVGEGQVMLSSGGSDHSLLKSLIVNDQHTSFSMCPGA